MAAHEHLWFAVHQAAYRLDIAMFDVDVRSQLAGPCAARQLTCRVSRLASIVDKDRDLLEAKLERA